MSNYTFVGSVEKRVAPALYGTTSLHWIGIEFSVSLQDSSVWIYTRLISSVELLFDIANRRRTFEWSNVRSCPWMRDWRDAFTGHTWFMTGNDWAHCGTLNGAPLILMERGYSSSWGIEGELGSAILSLSFPFMCQISSKIIDWMVFWYFFQSDHSSHGIWYFRSEMIDDGLLGYFVQCWHRVRDILEPHPGKLSIWILKVFWLKLNSLMFPRL